MLLVHPIKELLRFLPVLLGLLIAGSRSGGERVVVERPGHRRTDRPRCRPLPDHQLPDRRGPRRAAPRPAQQARAVDADRPGPHRRHHRLADPPGARPDHRADRHRHGLQAGRGRARPRRRPRARRRGAAQRPAAPHRLARGAGERGGARQRPAWSPGSSRGGSGTRRSPPRGWSSPRPCSVPAARCSTRWACGTTSSSTPPPSGWPGSRCSCWCRSLVVGLLVVASVLAVAGYLVTNFGFTVTYTRSDHAWHLRRGLFTTRETSMDANRLRGVNLVEPLGLRLARGARLSAIVTGLNREQQGSSTLVPPAPQEVARRVAAEVLGTAGAGRRPAGRPRTGRRTPPLHPRARAGRCVLTAALVVGVLVADVPPGWLALALAAVSSSAGLGHDRARGLGHALLPGHLVARSGSLMRRRVILETPAVIGWTFSSTLVPAPRRPDHRRGHDGRRPPVGHGPRRAGGDGYGAGARRRTGAGRAVPRDRWSRRPSGPSRDPASHGVS